MIANIEHHTNIVHDQRNYEFPQFSSPDERDHSEIMNMILTPPSPYQGAFCALNCL